MLTEKGMRLLAAGLTEGDCIAIEVIDGKEYEVMGDGRRVRQLEPGETPRKGSRVRVFEGDRYEIIAAAKRSRFPSDRP
jgi:hypothetical protein